MPHRTNTPVEGSGAQSVPATFENASRCMQEAVQGLLRALEVKVEERLNELLQRVEERVATLVERITGVEGRMTAVEASDTAPGERNAGQETAVKKLEERVQQVEASVQKALEEVFLRLDSLLLLEGNCPPAPFAVASSSSDSRQPWSLPSVSSASCTSSASPSPLAPSPAVPWSTLSPSANDIALGEELFKAAREGRVADVQRLLNEGANVDHRDEYDEQTPLMEAAYQGHVDIVLLLLKRGANVNARGNAWHTALHLASVGGRRCPCVELIDGKAHVQWKSIWGDTAKVEAATSSNEQVVRLLIAAGASNSLKDRHGKRPSDITRFSVIREILLSSSRQPPL